TKVTKGRAIDKVFMNQNGIFHIFMMLYTASLQSNSDLCVHRSYGLVNPGSIDKILQACRQLEQALQ
ncbi:MAG: hypothetical protein HC934_08450, partial [Acaryochloridaceae cyanobacterium SU_2_1]|nr:hypothetical protein [Acaryochloridaceae cyanobacterium SU_2_1]